MRGMSDSIFLLGDDGVLTEVASSPYGSEADLQKLLADHVHLLPGAQINRDSPRRWLLIKREAGIPNQEGGGDWWSIDHLVVDQDAVPTFVEVKRASDTRSRREVVAQMLDYAAYGSALWTPERLRTWFEGDDPEAATERLAAWLESAGDDPGSVADTFWDAVGANLREGKIRLVFVADEIPVPLQRLVEFLNEQMPQVEVLAVEIRQYRAAGSNSGALVSRVVGQTSRAQAAKERSASPARRSARWTADQVLESIAETGQDAAAVASVVCDWAERHAHVHIAGGTGVSYPSITLSADSGRTRTGGAVCCRCTVPRKGNHPCWRSVSSGCAEPLPITGRRCAHGWSQTSRAWASPASTAKTTCRASGPTSRSANYPSAVPIACCQSWTGGSRTSGHTPVNQSPPAKASPSGDAGCQASWLVLTAALAGNEPAGHGRAASWTSSGPAPGIPR